MYDAEEGCFKYTGKPVSKYSKKEDDFYAFPKSE